MKISYYQLTYEDIEQISRMEREFFSTPWSEASIGHYAEAGNTIFIVARSEEPYQPGTLLAEKQETGSLEAAGCCAGSEAECYAGSETGCCAGTGAAELPRKVVGYAAILCAADEGNLVSIGVLEECRRMGIATELLDIACEMAAQRGVASINLEVRESNLPAVRFYEKEGFVKTGKRPNFYRNPAEDALLYIKQL